jgi:UDP-glucose 4-epimerase
MDIAVIGAAGFVGQNLLAEFEGTDHTIRTCDIERPRDLPANATYHELDVTDEGAVEETLAGCDVIAHLAAHPVNESVDAPKLNAEINVTGTLNVLEAARAHDVEKVFFSSASSLIGEVSKVPVPEDHPAAPHSPYGVAKHAVEEYLAVYRRLYDLDYLVFRFFNVYGPHQPPSSGALVPVVLSRLANEDGVFVTGDGEQTRDFIYVRDITAFIREGLEGDVANEVVNMGTGTETAIIDAIELMADVVGTEPDIDYRPEREDEIDDFYADMSKCERLFGDTPSTDFETGLQRTFEWLRETQVD